MKKLVIGTFIGLLSFFSFIPFAIAGSPSVIGSWNVTFFLEPNRTIGATQCIVFTLVPGTVAGVPNSGTWTSPTFPGWSGEWIQLGDHVRWFGITGDLATTEAGNMEQRNFFGGVSFNHYSKTTKKTSTAGSWRGVRVARCAVGVEQFGGDPSQT